MGGGKDLGAGEDALGNCHLGEGAELFHSPPVVSLFLLNIFLYY